MNSATDRLCLRIRGKVQGVGFRPFLYRMALEFELQGKISNSDAGVAADLEGARETLETFLAALPRRVPPHAEIDHLEHHWLPPVPLSGLQIVASEDSGGRGARIPGDLATCARCLEEMNDPQDRRYHYPFINCTECGPRFTISGAIPYDRPLTSMASFELCEACAAEYQDPLDRRYHAEPIACAACGPRLQVVGTAGDLCQPDPIGHCVEALGRGQIVAVKGLGGFHLAVDAKNGQAIARLRRRKGRGHKPFAVMVRDLEEAHRHAFIDQEEVSWLTSARAPIVLLRGRDESSIAAEVAPGNPYLGLMLPYTPLHHLLLAEVPALVMTSGNLSEEPIAISNREARLRLGQMADAFVEHNRKILIACDDSVITRSALGPLLIRRSRGYVPDPVRLRAEVGQALATGGQLKNTFCLTLGAEAYLGPHVGDLDNLESYEHFQRSIEHMRRLLRINPEVVIHDLHPDYLTTRYAEELGLPTLAVQHHHAHLAATMLDHELEGPAVGLALDGTGYGADGTIWGGELFFLPDIGHFERRGHLRPFDLPGGDASIRAPRRTAMSLIIECVGIEAAQEAATLMQLTPFEARAVQNMVQRQVGVIKTTSCGRLFDAVAALCGLGHQVTYEGKDSGAVSTGCSGSSVYHCSDQD